MQLPIASPFWDAALLRTDLVDFILAWSGIAALLGLVAMKVQDALKRPAAHKKYSGLNT